MIDPTTLAVAGGAFVTFWGAKKLLVRVNRPKDKQLPRTENTVNQILRLEQWHMLWSHPDNNTEFYVWDDESGWVEQSTDRVVKDLIGWDDHSYNVRIRVGSKIGVEIVDGVWGPEHLEKVLDYGVFGVKELLSDYEETEKQYRISMQRRAYERGKIEAAARAVPLDAEYEERKRIDKAWKDSGKCRFCAGLRHGFSRDYCSTCWHARGTERTEKLPKHPDEYKTPIKRGFRGRIFSTMNGMRYGEFESTPQQRALDSRTNHPVDSRVQRIAKITEAIQQCEDGEMKRRLITRLEELENE